jgi:hypothetical protein
VVTITIIAGHTLLEFDVLRIPGDVDQRSELMSITIPK